MVGAVEELQIAVRLRSRELAVQLVDRSLSSLHDGRVAGQHHTEARGSGLDRRSGFFSRPRMLLADC
jgi:hypothetical protein